MELVNNLRIIKVYENNLMADIELLEFSLFSRLVHVTNSQLYTFFK